MNNSLQNHIQQLHDNIINACRKAQRDPKEITLIAVSKTHLPPILQETLALGLTIFGENRVQETEKKWPELIKQYPNTQLHLIGPLQSNKAKLAVKLFSFIHTIDRTTIVDAIAKAQKNLRLQPTCLIQINTGNESQKAGIPKNQFHSLLQYALSQNINIQGVMCIPPFHDDPSPHFQICSDLAEQYQLPIKSYGMSGDYKTAILHGASHIRVGSALFGTRTT